MTNKEPCPVEALRDIVDSLQDVSEGKEIKTEYFVKNVEIVVNALKKVQAYDRIVKPLIEARRKCPILLDENGEHDLYKSMNYLQWLSFYEDAANLIAEEIENDK